MKECHACALATARACLLPLPTCRRFLASVTGPLHTYPHRHGGQRQDDLPAAAERPPTRQAAARIHHQSGPSSDARAIRSQCGHPRHGQLQKCARLLGCLVNSWMMCSMCKQWRRSSCPSAACAAAVRSSGIAAWHVLDVGCGWLCNRLAAHQASSMCQVDAVLICFAARACPLLCAAGDEAVQPGPQRRHPHLPQPLRHAL